MYSCWLCVNHRDVWFARYFCTFSKTLQNFSICSPCNYHWQKAITFNIVIEETANFCCQSFIYNLLWTFLYLLNKIFSFIQMFTLLRKDSSPDYFTQSISFPFILGFSMLRWSKQYANIGLYYALCRRAQFTIYFIFFKKVYTSFYNLCIYILSKRFKLIT